jgi:hypothetical protein
MENIMKNSKVEPNRIFEDGQILSVEIQRLPPHQIIVRSPLPPHRKEIVLNNIDSNLIKHLENPNNEFEVSISDSNQNISILAMFVAKSPMPPHGIVLESKTNVNISEIIDKATKIDFTLLQ